MSFSSFLPFPLHVLLFFPLHVLLFSFFLLFSFVFFCFSFAAREDLVRLIPPPSLGGRFGWIGLAIGRHEPAIAFFDGLGARKSGWVDADAAADAGNDLIAID